MLDAMQVCSARIETSAAIIGHQPRNPLIERVHK